MYLRRPLPLVLAAALALSLTSSSSADESSILRVGDVVVSEGDAATFTVTLDAPSTDVVRVDYSTGADSATAGVDYTTTAGRLNFGVGETTKQVTVPVVEDALDEVDEHFVLNLANSVSASLGDAQGLGTITDDDPLPALVIDDVTVTEGNTGTVTANFEVTLAPASGRAVSVQYATTDGTATAPLDYPTTSGALQFAPGETAAQLTVPVNPDAIDEINETFSVTLSSATGATIADPTGLATITDDDALPTVSVNDVTVTEGNSGSVAANFVVSLSAASGRAVTVGFATANATAVAPGDYASRSDPVTIPAGQRSLQVPVQVSGDALDEVTETYLVNLSAPENATIADGQGVGTITDNDPQPVVAIADATVVEGDTGTKDATFTVTLDAVSGREVRVNYATANGTATAPGDYTSASGLLTFAPGETAKSVLVPVRGDVLDEPDSETFTVNLTSPVGATLADTSGLGAITDDDALPTVSVNDVTVSEGSSGSVAANFVVSLSAASGRAVTVGFATANATAVAPGDYASRSDPVTIPAGQRSLQVPVQVSGDALDEVTETYLVNLSAPENATIADGQGVGTIIDYDGLATVSLGDVVVGEGNSGTVNANFTVSLSAPIAQPVSVGVATADRTAVAGQDYEAGSGNLAFAPGATTRTFQIKVSGDLADELDETFAVVLSAPTNAEIGDGEAIGVIVDDDAPPTISIEDVTVAEGTGAGTSATFTTTLSRPSGRPITVGYATADNTATAGGDYGAVAGTLGFEPGQGSKTITVPVSADGAFEPDETFVVNLAGPVNADLLRAQAVGTITNDDAAPPTPTPPPPPVDTEAPGEVGNVFVRPGDRTLTVSWGNPTAADFLRVNVTRIGAGKTAQNRPVYDGSGTAFTDRGLKNGVAYRYRIRTYDRAGNGSAGRVVTAKPKAVLTPAGGTVVSAPPLLRWVAIRGATYYNLQLHLVRRGGQAKAVAATKVLSVWPSRPSYKLTSTWRYGGRRHSLVPGLYRWYVWPGLGKRTANTYGPLVGESTFTVKTKTAGRSRSTSARRG